VNAEWVYQVRVAAEETLEDVVTALTHAVWTALQQVRDFRGPAPSRWANLHGDYSKVFSRRLRYEPGCGSQPECRYSTGVYGGRTDRTPSGPIFILTLRGGLLRFVEGLSALACRRYRNGGGRAELLSRGCKDRIQGALHRALAPYLYFNEGCSHCPTRKALKPVYKLEPHAPEEGLNEKRGGRS
jgi:hypothetical protein